jgi:hypothetical protein
MTSGAGGEPDPQPVPIDAGLPGGRSEWPPGVLESLRAFVQGHVVKEPPFHYFADPARPVWVRTHAYVADSTGPEVIELPEGAGPAFGMITSQTCDIAEEDAEWPIRPWVQIVPVYDLSADLNSGIQKLLRKGKGTSYLMYLPGLADGFWVADFRIEVPVEKGWLAAQRPVEGFLTEEQRQQVGERVAMLRSRPAFDGRFVAVIQRPLVTELRELKQADLGMYQRMDAQVWRVAVELDSLLNPKDVRVTLLTQGDVDEDIEDWWRAWWDSASGRCASEGMTLHAFAIRKTCDVTLAESERMTIVPLARISPDS